MVTVIAFVGSFLLANHFENKNIKLPPQVIQSMRWFESLFLDVQELGIQAKENLENKAVISEPSLKLAKEVGQNYSHIEVGSSPICKNTSLGELKYKKVGNIYTWTDEKEVYHVSDKPPKEGKFKLFNYVGKNVFDYFSLDLNADSLPYDFNQKLTLKLNKLFELYGELLDRSSLKKVDINLRIYDSKIDFNQIKAKNNMTISDNTLGFYSHASNEAYLLLTDKASTIRTATHEATHAINRGIIGRTPKWLNEGLAEYSEYIEVNGQSTKVYPNNNWTRKARLSKQLLPLSTLFLAKEKEWDSGLKHRLYATSWAFVYFMMEQPNRKAILAKLIKSEQQNRCDIIDKNKIEQQLEIPLNVLQKQFSNWSKSKLRTQSI